MRRRASSSGDQPETNLSAFALAKVEPSPQRVKLERKETQLGEKNGNLRKGNEQNVAWKFVRIPASGCVQRL
jgi:hypothetical protein